MHVIRQLGRGVWAAVSATYYEGGRTTLNGTPRDDRISGSRVAATLSVPIDRQNSLKFSASGGVYARTGSDFQSVGVLWQHIWGD